MIRSLICFKVFVVKYTWVFCLLMLAATAFSVELAGQWRQGGILRGQVASGSNVEFMGRKVEVSSRGEYVIGLGRDAASKAVLRVIDVTGRAQSYSFDVTPQVYNIQHVNGVPNKTVNPSVTQQARTKKEAGRVWLARQKLFTMNDFMQPFVWPLQGPITGVYGSQRVYNGEPRRPHYGVDIAAPVGTPIYAPAAGIITLAEADLFYSGGTIILDHGHRLSSTFMHLSKVLVKVGDPVEQGQLLAEVGATGRATGAHLDWRMNWQDQRVDPTTLVGAMPATK